MKRIQQIARVTSIALVLAWAAPLETAMAFDEKMPEKFYSLHYQCTGKHKVSLTYNSIDDIPSGGSSVEDKMMIDGIVYEASYYNKTASAIVNEVTSYPIFSARNSQQDDMGVLFMTEGSQGHTCVKLR